MATVLEQNAITLEQEVRWLEEVIRARMEIRFGKTEVGSVESISMPDLTNDNSILARVIKYLEYGFEERVILALSMAPHIKPGALDRFFLKNKLENFP